MKATNKSTSNIYEVFYPVSSIFKATGLFPFSFKGSPTNGVLRTTYWDILLFAAWIVLCGSMLVCNFINFHDALLLNTKILDISGKVNAIIGILNSLVCSFYAWRKRENIKKFINVLSSFDDKVSFYVNVNTLYKFGFLFQIKLLKIQQNLKQHRSFAVKWTFLSTMILNLLMIIISNASISMRLSNKPGYILIFSYIIVTFSYVLVNYQFVFATLSIRERFSVLNQNLVFYFPAMVRSNGEVRIMINFSILDAIIQMYDELSDSILLVNSTFTFQVVHTSLENFNKYVN